MMDLSYNKIGNILQGQFHDEDQKLSLGPFKYKMLLRHLSGNEEVMAIVSGIEGAGRRALAKSW